MRFETYISDLLYRYECVVIPEFGAFLTRPVSARIDEASHTFYPPKKVLSFNEQLKSNDGLLVNYIANVEKIPYESALKKVEKKMSVLKSYLAQGETIAFKNVGDLTLSPEGKLQFEPSYSLNYLTESFGLSHFVSPSISREVYKKEVKELEKVMPIAITPEKRKSSSFLKYASIAVLALTLGGWLSSNYYLGQIEQHNQLAQEEANKLIESRVQEATFVIDNPLPVINFNVTKQSGNFHIVAGAFRIEENCDKKLAELKGLGYPARKIGANKYGLHQVVYSSFESRSDAISELRSVRSNHDKEAWLLVQKLD